MSVSEAFSVAFFTLIKLCYTKTLEWSSLVPGPGVKSSSEITNPTLFAIILGAHPGSSGQGKSSQSSSLCFLSMHIFHFTNSTACLCEWITRPAPGKWWALLCGFVVPRNDWRQPLKGESYRGLYWPANAKKHPRSLWGERPEMGKACAPNFPSSVTFSWSLGPFRNCMGNQNY